MMFWTSCSGGIGSMILELHFKIISRKKYEGTKITFKSIADLRKEMHKNIPKTDSTLHLIKSFIETNLNNNGKKQVRHHILIYTDILYFRDSILNIF